MNTIYENTVLEAKLTELLNSPEFKDLFGSAQNKNEASSSGTAQEATPV